MFGSIMMVPNTAQEENVSTDDTLLRIQRLRLRRFGMALTTYAFVILASVLVSRLGLGEMNKVQWVMFIGLAIFGNIVFFVLFRRRNLLSARSLCESDRMGRY